MDRRAFLAGTGAVAASLTGCLGLSEANDEYDIGMSDMRFLPTTETLPQGSTVVWKNTSSRAHTVTAYGETLPDGAEYFASGGYESERAARDAWFQSGGGAIYPGETYRHTFEQAGRFPYVCIPHEASNMVGTVVVEEVE